MCAERCGLAQGVEGGEGVGVVQVHSEHPKHVVPQCTVAACRCQAAVGAPLHCNADHCQSHRLLMRRQLRVHV